MRGYVVFVESWQMQCCGESFGPGDCVSWTVEAGGDSEFLELLFGTSVRCDAFEDHHDLLTSPEPVRGLVRAVRAVTCRYSLDGKTLVPVPASAEMVPVLRADGWEPETESQRFVGYLVTLDTDSAVLDADDVAVGMTLLFERVAADADRLSLDVGGDPDQLVRTGTDLLVAGFDTPEVIDLAALSPGGRWVDTIPVARAAFESIGVPVPPEDDAGWNLALFWAERLTDPDYPSPESAAHHLWGLWWQLGNPDEIGALVLALEDVAVARPDQLAAYVAKLRELGGSIVVRARAELSRDKRCEAPRRRTGWRRFVTGIRKVFRI